jgi:hypothetical protein
MRKNFTIINPWLEALTAGDGISQDDLKNRIVSVVLRESNNLIMLNWNNELYVDLQLEDWLTTSDTLPVGVTTGRVLQADWWIKNWTMLCFKTTSWDYVTWIYGDDGKLYIDNWTWTFKQIYLKAEVDALFTQLRWELATVAFTWDYNDLINKPVLWTAASKDVWTNPWNVPILDNTGKLDRAVVPVVLMHTFTVQTKQDLTTLTEARAWDIWIVADDNQTYILQIDPYSTLSNWTELLTPTSSVTSVNWQTWAVTLTTNNISEYNNKLYVSWTEKSYWNSKLWTNNVATVALTGSYSDLTNKPAIPAGQIQSDRTQNDQSAVDYIKHKPTIDSTLSTSSTNAIQNWAVATAISTINWDIGTIQWDITNIQGDITTIQGSLWNIVSDTAFWSSWDWDTTHAPSKNAIYDVLWDVETLLANI